MQNIEKNALKYVGLTFIGVILFILFCFRNIYTADGAIETYTEFYNKRKLNIDTVFKLLDILKNNECFYSIHMRTRDNRFSFHSINDDSCKLLSIVDVINEDELRTQLKLIGINDLSFRRYRNTLYLDGRNLNLKDYEIDMWNDTTTIANTYCDYKKIKSAEEIEGFGTAWVYQLDTNVYLVSEAK